MSISPRLASRLVAALLMLGLMGAFAVRRSAPEGRSRSAAESDTASSLGADISRNLAELRKRGPSSDGPLALCWSGPVPDEVRAEFEFLLFGPEPEYQLNNRWTTTATNGGSSATQGTPVTLTYSFVPDGTAIGSGVGEPASPSNLFAAFNAAFPSQATWQSRIHAVFASWSLLSGITYVFEPNDDGVAISSSAGVLGVRGDVRIGGHSIDGSAGANTLAYNSYPNNGDMVIDTDNAAYFANSTNDYRRLRNVVAHEAGHGVGLRHVCPESGTKLMEPTIDTSYDGPQFDDILGSQRNYGDDYEPNDSGTQFHDLGLLDSGTVLRNNASIDDDSDSDWFRFQVTGDRAATVLVTPLGSTYNQGAQAGNGSCPSGSAFNALAVHDLSFQVRGGVNGGTVLRTVNAVGAGSAESVFGVPLIFGPGFYFVRVAGSAANEAQLYRLNVIVTAASFPTLTQSSAAGTYPLGQTPVDTLKVNLSSGGPDRRVEIPATASAMVIGMDQPTTNPAPALYLVFGTFGAPTPAETYPLVGFGDFCFTPCVVDPLNPLRFLLIDSFANLNTLCGTNILPSTVSLPLLTPVFLPPGIPSGITVTLQGFFDQGGGLWAISNAVLIYFY